MIVLSSKGCCSGQIENFRRRDQHRTDDKFLTVATVLAKTSKLDLINGDIWTFGHRDFER
jgi:hypothetical protein